MPVKHILGTRVNTVFTTLYIYNVDSWPRSEDPIRDRHSGPHYDDKNQLGTRGKHGYRWKPLPCVHHNLTAVNSKITVEVLFLKANLYNYQRK